MKSDGDRISDKVADVTTDTTCAKRVVSDTELNTPIATSCSRSTSAESMTPGRSTAVCTGESRSTLSPCPAVPEQDAELVQVPLWPRTMSGDDLRVAAGTVEEAAPTEVAPVATWPRTMSGDNLQLLVGVGLDPVKETPQPQGGLWPRTMSGDDLHNVTGVRSSGMDMQPPIGSHWTPAGSGNNSHQAAGAVCLGSSPAKEVEYDSYWPSPSPMPQWPRTMSGDDLESVIGSQASFAALSPDRLHSGQDASASVSAMPPPPPQQMPPTLFPTAMPPVPSMPAGTGPPIMKVSLADAIPQPELGSVEFPTIGSAGHRQGTCKPCAFLHTKGCHSGKDCTFCHLCEAGEKKRRQKEKKELRKEMLRMQQQTPQQEQLPFTMHPGFPPR